ncbi:50S ribosomal protein L2 [Candidatus Falkowbacteria bacterium CG10_big_fil_rev_8_21_14_0_10_39_11]|uniref:Large ribosomal subunit protein uL2 n=1 Tax=Candidatus Falkowbacteria bacterium CG10_big_fil_rev_8_21_14_0_10_39_11 TaxID=1974565 RepID=A0A2H0V5S9_9BACT|nr:MAG: 50S ribosomal protein L2 [Candidatus Falkowbacteria bacterium CG10_big_fil_rev_8_21_14_0_10_39_11]
MGIKVYKPISNARRKMSVDDFSDITKTKPEKALITIKKRSGGRNAHGRITVRHRGGGAKRFIRTVDFKRDKIDIPGTVTAIEYDPNRNARLALITYKDGEKRYIIAPTQVAVGSMVISSRGPIDIQPGNATTLENIPTGAMVYNIELVPGKGGQMVRSAGVQAKLMAIEGRYAQLRLPSGEVRLVPKECIAVIGQVSNPEAMHIKIGKAGRKRHMGIKPTVRGKAMNPVDHPHGGGEARNPIGMKHPKTPWGKPALGVRTRRRKPSDKLIIRRRKTGKRR